MKNPMAGIDPLNPPPLLPIYATDSNQLQIKKKNGFITNRFFYNCKIIIISIPFESIDFRFTILYGEPTPIDVILRFND